MDVTERKEKRKEKNEITLKYVKIVEKDIRYISSCLNNFVKHYFYTRRKKKNTPGLQELFKYKERKRNVNKKKKQVV